MFFSLSSLFRRSTSSVFSAESISVGGSIAQSPDSGEGEGAQLLCCVVFSVVFYLFTARFAFQMASLFFCSATKAAYGGEGVFGADSVRVSSMEICRLGTEISGAFGAGFCETESKGKMF